MPGAGRGLRRSVDVRKKIRWRSAGLEDHVACSLPCVRSVCGFHVSGHHASSQSDMRPAGVQSRRRAADRSTLRAAGFSPVWTDGRAAGNPRRDRPASVQVRLPSGRSLPPMRILRPAFICALLVSAATAVVAIAASSSRGLEPARDARAARSPFALVADRFEIRTRVRHVRRRLDAGVRPRRGPAGARRPPPRSASPSRWPRWRKPWDLKLGDVAVLSCFPLLTGLAAARGQGAGPGPRLAGVHGAGRRRVHARGDAQLRDGRRLHAHAARPRASR